MGHWTSFPSDALERSEKCEKPHKKLTTKERKRQIVKQTKELLAGCVDKELLCKMGMNHFDGNKELAIAALNVLDGTRGQIQRELKVNVKEIEKENVEQTDGEEEPPSPFVAFETAMVLLGKTT